MSALHPTPAPMTAPWTPLDLSRPAAHLRQIAGLSLARAAAALDLAISTVHSSERREGVDGQGITMGTFRRRAKAWGVEVEIRVRRVSP